MEYDPILPKYIIQRTTTTGVTTKYETVEEAVAALQNGDLLETIGKLEYDGVIDIINKEITISGQIEFTSANAKIQISGKTLTLKDLTITGIANYPVATNGSRKSTSTKIYVGENSNVSMQLWILNDLVESYGTNLEIFFININDKMQNIKNNE